MEPTAALETRDLVKRYVNVVAADRVTLRVLPGQVYGLLGPNGAGKSTVIRCCLGYLHPTAGSTAIRVTHSGEYGDDVRNPRLRCRVGYLPGDLRLEPRMTAKQITGFHVALRRRYGAPISDADVSDLARRLDLDMTRRFATLSKGNRQKVGVLLALMGTPDLLVLDEPTTGLDPLVQDVVLDLIREHRDRGAAILLSTHILAEAESIADRVGVLSRGRLVTDRAVPDLMATARQHLIVTLREAPHDGDLRGVPGVISASRLADASGDGADTLAITIEGSARALFERLAPLGIERVRSEQTEIDEVFHASVKEGAA